MPVLIFFTLILVALLSFLNLGWVLLNRGIILFQKVKESGKEEKLS